MFIISTLATDAVGQPVRLYYRHFIDQTLGLFAGPWTRNRGEKDIYQFDSREDAEKHAKLNIISEVNIEQI